MDEDLRTPPMSPYSRDNEPLTTPEKNKKSNYYSECTDDDEPVVRNKVFRKTKQEASVL